jgi:hypothetical protein
MVLPEQLKNKLTRQTHVSVSQRTRNQRLRLLAPRTHVPRKRLRMAEKAASDVYVGHDLVPLRVLGSNDVDGREQRRDHRE